jgi:hypothetical protein
MGTPTKSSHKSTGAPRQGVFAHTWLNRFIRRLKIIYDDASEVVVDVDQSTEE